MATSSTKTLKTSTIRFDDALTNYYKLKQDYTKIKNKEVSKLLDNNSLSDTEKKDKFAQFKRKCINCGKFGGTIFKQDKNILIAQCGSDQPCKLKYSN